MYGDNVFCLQQLAGDKCIIGVHSEVAADRKHCIVKGVELWQQLHIAEECGVTGKVQLGAVEINDDTAGVTAGNATAVEGQRQAYLAERKLKGAAKMCALQPASCARPQISAVEMMVASQFLAISKALPKWSK